MADDDLAHIRQHMNQERVLGDERFQRMVEKTLARPATCQPRGRPKLNNEI
jgi:putative transposase